MYQDALDFSAAAKCILIFWCLFAFIASGFEHSMINMTLFSIALLGQHPDTVSLGDRFYNLLWVTLGNANAGSVFRGAAYWANGKASASTATVTIPAE